ncbi:CoA pyrophosphatase [Archangium sp.]|uniref:CoA pyrophosphatase n=1 Tax=Archangium sp. TaxID=1872627 RepID=UPI002ED81A89
MDTLFDALEARLASRPPRAVNLPGLVLREAAVLVPLLVREGSPHILFTKRPTTLRHHAGQYSFPGGSRDAEDTTPLHTALRETREELGIDVSGVRVLGALDEVPTLTEFRIQPFVGVIPEGVEYQPSPDEVEFILEVPLAALLDPTLRRTERRSVRGMEYEVDFYTYGSHVIWGATGRILRDLLRLASELSGRP